MRRDCFMYVDGVSNTSRINRSSFRKFSAEWKSFCFFARRSVILAIRHPFREPCLSSRGQARTIRLTGAGLVVHARHLTDTLSQGAGATRQSVLASVIFNSVPQIDPMSGG